MHTTTIKHKFTSGDKVWWVRETENHREGRAETFDVMYPRVTIGQVRCNIAHNGVTVGYLLNRGRLGKLQPACNLYRLRADAKWECERRNAERKGTT